MCRDSNSLGFPSATSWPSIRPTTPWPVIDWNASTLGSWIFFSTAPATMAAAKGCSLARSSAAAKRRSSVSSIPGPPAELEANRVISFGFPSVSVPVLSTTSVSTFSMTSSASAFFTNTPAIAPRPVPTMIDIGVAKPNAHGQATISTATLFTIALAKRSSPPTAHQTANVTIAIAITAGTNQPDTTSANR